MEKVKPVRNTFKKKVIIGFFTSLKKACPSSWNEAKLNEGLEAWFNEVPEAEADRRRKFEVFFSRQVTANLRDLEEEASTPVIVPEKKLKKVSFVKTIN